jgi:hypothetical protein
LITTIPCLIDLVYIKHKNTVWSYKFIKVTNFFYTQLNTIFFAITQLHRNYYYSHIYFSYTLIDAAAIKGFQAVKLYTKDWISFVIYFCLPHYILLFIFKIHWNNQIASQALSDWFFLLFVFGKEAITGQKNWRLLS